MFPVRKHATTSYAGSQCHHMFRLKSNSLLLSPPVHPHDEIHCQQPVLTELHGNDCTNGMTLVLKPGHFISRLEILVAT